MFTKMSRSAQIIETDELETLHREYRNMEANRKAYAEESAAVG